jgi:curved DNA-binding protein CbpA
MSQDYYAILEIASDADLTVIKSQYRKLVRQNHPDIATDKETAHARMQLILEAYNILSNEEKRSAYDRSRNAPPAPTARSAARRATPGPMPGTSSRSATRSVYGGHARAARGQHEWSNQAPASASTNPRMRLLSMVYDAAQLHFKEGQTDQAIAICERIMKSDNTNAEAPALLGDIYADQGNNDLALVMYERAMRRRPDNLNYRQKYELLSGSGIPIASSNGKKKTQSAGCGAKVLFWLFIFALTPFLWEFISQQ